MPFQVSPGVNVTEIDLTTVVPAVSTTEGAIGGVFKWGPVNKRVLISSEQELAARFGKPATFNAETFFTAANFLSYGNKLYVSRGANTTSNQDIVLLFPNPAKFQSGLTVYQRDETGANIAVGVATAANATSLTINATSIQGSFQTYTGSNTNLMLIGGSNTSVIDTVQEDDTVSRNAVALSNNYNLIQGGTLTTLITKNEDDYNAKDDLGEYATDSNVLYVAKYPGAVGSSLKISVCDSPEAFQSTLNTQSSNTYVNNSVSDVSVSVGSNTLLFRCGVAEASNVTMRAVTNTVITTIRNGITVGDVIVLGNTTVGLQYNKVTGVGGLEVNSTHSYTSVSLEDVLQLSSDFSNQSVTRHWEYFNSVDKSVDTSTFVATQGNTAAKDEIHVVIVDQDGLITSVPGTILEVYEGLSRATNAKTNDGATIYYKDVINLNSPYVWFANDRANAASATALEVASSTNTLPYTGSFIRGKDGKDESSCSLNVLTQAYDLFASAEEVDVSLILQGKARGGSYGEQLGNYIIDNICESRKDCVAFISPERATVVSNAGDESNDIVTFRNACRSTSYAVIDSGYKYQYDKYNDVYRYVPLNGDMAGLTVRTDQTRDPWWSPAGLNRGQIKNIIKLAYNPNKANRDILYKSGINPVVTFPGQGTVLFGDKTMLSKPSAFDRINVRRLFIVLEKAIATAAKFTLFEFNDSFTRSQFRNLVEPFLRDVQGRRGIYDFKVVCDETNNTGEVIDRNEFIGDIYIKPARSINFIQLNFVAVRTGIEFSEVVGKF
jgi:phage tail sheath protein FI